MARIMVEIEAEPTIGIEAQTLGPFGSWGEALAGVEAWIAEHEQDDAEEPVMGWMPIIGKDLDTGETKTFIDDHTNYWEDDNG